MAGLLHELVATQALREPGRTAVVLGADRLTYGELDDVSNQMARCLRDSGCNRGDRVALLMPKSLAAIAALVGIYKAGCVYVPLDPASPQTRLKKIFDSCDCQLVLTDETSPDICVQTLSATPQHLAAYSRDPIDAGTSADDPAHILFTSGSTGVPKGVVITHANVMRFLDWAVPYFQMNASDCISGHPPLHFDLSFFDIFGAFAAGAELHLVPAELSVLPNKVADLIRRSALTQWFSVPS